MRRRPGTAAARANGCAAYRSPRRVAACGSGGQILPLPRGNSYVAHTYGTPLAAQRPMPSRKRSGHEPSARGTALLLVDFMNPLDFDGADALAPHAVLAARCAARLRARMRSDGVPIIYANDNFGRWESEFSAVVASCEKRGGASSTMARLLAPEPGDRSVLKPRHSAFFGTPLDFLLDELEVSRLVLTGLAADSCIMFTAHDAYLREFDLWIPADCVASEQDAWRDDALAYMARVLKARVDPSEEVESRAARATLPRSVPSQKLR